MSILRQSTAVTIKLGPFSDSTDGVTAETALTIQKANVRLSANGGNMAAANADQGVADAGAPHDELGYYDVSLDATDTATVGRLKVMVSAAGALPVWAEYQVVEEAVYDALFAAAAAGYSTYAGADTSGTTTLLSRIVGTLLAGNHTAQTGDSYAVVNHETHGLDKLVRSGTPANTLAVDVSGNVAANNMRGTDNAALAATAFNPATQEVTTDAASRTASKAEGFAVAGDAMTLTPAERTSIGAAVLTAVQAAGTYLTRLFGLVEDSTGDRFTAKALEEAPAGEGANAAAIATEVYAAGRVFPAANLANAPTGPQANYTVERATVGSLGHLTVERWQYEALGSFAFVVPAAPTFPVHLVAWQPGRTGTPAFRLSSADGDITVSDTTITIAADDTYMDAATTYRWTLDDATDTAIAEGSIIVKPRPDPLPAPD